MQAYVFVCSSILLGAIGQVLFAKISGLMIIVVGVIVLAKS